MGLIRSLMEIVLDGCHIQEYGVLIITTILPVGYQGNGQAQVTMVSFKILITRQKSGTLVAYNALTV